jgi:uncharacterized alkaline shock family protein YloU
MTDERDEPQLKRLGLEPEDLDGHTIDELADYLDAGRSPADPSIDGSPGCQLALDALERLRGVTSALVEADAADAAGVDGGWVDRILSGIALDARAGRRIPYAADDERLDLGITEGAVRGLVRAAEESFAGVLVGRCRLDGDVETAGAPVAVDVEVSVPYGESLPRLAQDLRSEIGARLAAHTELNVSRIDVTIEDVALPMRGGAEDGRS